MKAAGVRPRANYTGLPDHLKSGIESLSELSLDHVRVHYNSSRPTAINALAYTQAADIYVAPGQERHLPHEAWHVVQQAQGRVRPTRQFTDGVSVNDDDGLEREADVMGARAATRFGPAFRKPLSARGRSTSPSASPMQFGAAEIAAWRKEHGFRSKSHVVDHLAELFRNHREQDAWVMLQEYNRIATLPALTIKSKEIEGYREPPDERQRDDLRRGAQERTYLRHEPVRPGDLVYGRGEVRDPYVFSNKQPYDVIDDLNNQFLGTRSGEPYGTTTVPATNEESRQRAQEFREFLTHFKPAKAPEATRGGDPVSINARLRRASKYGISFTGRRGNIVRFVLDGLQQAEVVGKSRRDDVGSTASGNKIRAITGSELRYLYRRRHDAAFMAAIEFYDGGHKLDVAPWEQDPHLRTAYAPKGEQSTKWRIIRNVELDVHNLVNSLPRQELKSALRPFARQYMAAFIGAFDRAYAGQELDEIGDLIVQGSYDHFIAAIKRVTAGLLLT